MRLECNACAAMLFCSKCSIIMTTSVGRPRSFDREEVLDAALDLFWSQGYRSATTRELESSLGLNASSIYNAFGSKEALLVEALRRYEQRITSALLEPLELSPEGLGALDAFFEDLAQWMSHNGQRGCLLVNMMGEDAGATRAISTRVDSYRARLRRAFAGALLRAAAAREISHGVVESRADLLMCQVLGLNIAARGGARPSELKRLVASVQRQVAEWRTSRLR